MGMKGQREYKEANRQSVIPTEIINKRAQFKYQIGTGKNIGMIDV